MKVGRVSRLMERRMPWEVGMRGQARARLEQSGAPAVPCEAARLARQMPGNLRRVLSWGIT